MEQMICLQRMLRDSFFCPNLLPVRLLRAFSLLLCVDAIDVGSKYHVVSYVILIVVSVSFTGSDCPFKVTREN